MYEVRNPAGTVAWCETHEDAIRVALKVPDAVMVDPPQEVRPRSFLDGLAEMYGESHALRFHPLRGWE